MAPQSISGAFVRRRRGIWVGIFFVGLVLVEVAHGAFHIAMLRRRAQAALVDEARTRHADLARDLSALFDGGRENASYLSRCRAVADLLRDPENQTNVRAFDELVLPYIVAFRGVDAVAVLSADGREIRRCERIGQGVGTLPPGVGDDLSTSGAEIPLGANAFDVVAGGLVRDDHRVEVPESDRIVLHYVAAVDDDGKRLGRLVLRVYASPYLNAVRRFEPVDGAFSAIVDEVGGNLSSNARIWAAAATALTSVSGTTDEKHARIDVEVADGWFLAQRIGNSPRRWLVAQLPRESVVLTARDRASSFWVFGTTVAITLVISLGALYFLRLSNRERILREESRFIETVRRESQKYRRLMEDAADMILLVDPAAGVIREANAVARQTLGFAEDRPEIAAPPTLESFVSEADRARWRDASGRIVETGQPTLVGELHLGAKSGKEIVTEGRGALIEIEGNTWIQWVIRDLTQRREIERQLRIAERLGSLGQLTAGVAHEINNPLEGIGNYLALADRDSTDPEKRKKYLELVRHGLTRIRDIVRDLGTFARPGIATGTADLVAVVERARQMVAYGKETKAIEFEFSGFENPIVLRGDGGRLEQVFINLFINAAQAMRGQGKITVTASRIDRPADGPPRVVVFVDDTGPGIPEAIIGRIFDPFYSSKESSGLGLAISYGIMRDHQGAVTAENLPGAGARFVLTWRLEST